MLQPDDRSLLAELLAPPRGYQLEHAVGTTFTLDLAALMVIPLGFTGADLVDDPNPFSVLQSVRHYANRVDVFCQRGMIKVPLKSNRLFEFLEPIIHTVGSPRPGALFHPKMWVLRFGPTDLHSGEPWRFRFICGSRNLTFDRSWDAVVSLDGVAAGRRRAYNNPLCAFLRSLPERTTGLEKDRNDRMNETIALLHNVEWERPEGASRDPDWLRFHVFGPAGSARPDMSGSRLLVVSPFVTPEGLTQFDSPSTVHVISRPEQLDALDETGRDFLSRKKSLLFTVNDLASLSNDDDNDEWDLAGLHAKIYVVERGLRAHLFIGSANATNLAWNGNDEILVEIIGGKKNYFGIDTMIGDSNEASKRRLRSILTEHTLGTPVLEDSTDELLRRLERDLLRLASIDYVSRISGSDGDGWMQTLSATSVVVPDVEDVVVRYSPLSRPDLIAAPNVDGALESRWSLDSLEEVTPFVVLTFQTGEMRVSTVVLSRLEDCPSDRLDRVLASQFKNERDFLHFIALLLAMASDSSVGSPVDALSNFGGVSHAWGSNGSGVLEVLLRSLSRSPSSVDDVGRLVQRLSTTTAGQQVLPQGWVELWTRVSAARELIGGARELN